LDRRSPINPSAVLAVIIGSYAMIIIDTSIVMTGLPHIRVDLAMNAGEMSWVQSIYTLFFGGFLLLGARVGDVFGARRALQIGLFLFMVTSMAIAFAQSPAWMRIARACQGIGAALVAPSALALLTLNFKDGEARNRAVAWYGATAGIGASVGLLLGGWLADITSWRAGFILNLPIALLLIWGAWAYVRESEKIFLRFDFIGALLSTFAIGTIIYGVSEASKLEWSDPLVTTCLGAGGLLLIAFTWHESRAESPLMPLHLFSSGRRAGAYLARFLFLGPMVGFFFFSSQYMQEVWRFSSLQAGLGFFPMTMAAFAVPMTVPKLIRAFGEATVLVSGLMMIFIGLRWLSLVQTDSSFWFSMALPMVLVGAGQGLSLAPLTSAGVSNTQPHEAGAASSITNVCHQVGASFSLSLIASVSAASLQGISNHTHAVLIST
jgi:EmrB/QacA subfamily drug resistance transporter